MDAGLAALTGGANLALSSGKKAPYVGGGLNIAAAKKAAQDFETFFASQVLEQMFSNVKTDGLFGGGHGEEMFRSLLLDSYAKQIGKSGSFGIANQVMKSLLAQQEVAS
jgi:Rod binding domain-containing protein